MGAPVTPRRAAIGVAFATLVAAVLYLGVAREQPGLAPLMRWFASWFGGDGPGRLAEYTFADIRLPRLLVAAFGGASLALAGALMQATFRNPLASPELLGTSAGAAFGGALALVNGWSQLGIGVTPALSLAGALTVTALMFVLAHAHGRFSIATLLLAGIALNTLVGALTSFIVTFSFSNYTASSEVLFWLMGGLEARTWQHAGITVAGCVVFAAMAMVRRRDLDVLTLHDDVAHSLGVPAASARRWLVFCACGLTATTVCNTGGIAFLGLVVPHLARLLVGPSHRVLLPTSAFLGALLLVVSDWICRLSPAEWNVRLGVLTAFLGTPYFLWLLARHRRGEAL
jgi:iron complex transport system permease protein